MAKRGGGAKTAIRRSGSTEWVDISAAVHGLDGLDTTEEEGTVEVAGGGTRTGMATTGYVTVGATFTVDENARSGPVLTGFNGGTLEIRYRRDGDGAGKPEAVYTGPVTVSHSFGERDKRRYSVDMMVNGGPTRTTQ